MVTINLIDHTGVRHTVDVPPGTTVMHAAVDHAVPGIDGDCGGNRICGTCHVFVAGEWAAATGQRGGQEAEMVELIEGADDRSRLSCQITVTTALDGLVVHLPQYQQ
jgi:2Fe-2S ferredoxin